MCIIAQKQPFCQVLDLYFRSIFRRNEFLVALKIMYLGATPLEYFNAARYGAAYIINMGEVMLNYNKL